MSSAGVQAHAATPPASASGGGRRQPAEETKRPFRPAPDDTKPVFRDPISRSDPVEAEQTALWLPPFP